MAPLRPPERFTSPQKRQDSRPRNIENPGGAARPPDFFLSLFISLFSGKFGWELEAPPGGQSMRGESTRPTR
jgi:hypothetical protein